MLASVCLHETCFTVVPHCIRIRKYWLWIFHADFDNLIFFGFRLKNILPILIDKNY